MEKKGSMTVRKIKKCETTTKVTLSLSPHMVIFAQLSFHWNKAAQTLSEGDQVGLGTAAPPRFATVSQGPGTSQLFQSCMV